MVSVVERRKHARSKQPAGSVSRYAQQRVDQRVMDVMARHDAQRRESHSAQIRYRRRGAWRLPGRDTRRTASSRDASTPASARQTAREDEEEQSPDVVRRFATAWRLGANGRSPPPKVHARRVCGRTARASPCAR
jgi:hypothetical protein